MNLFQRKVVQAIHVCDESNAEIFCYEGGDSVFVGRFADDSGGEGVGGIGAVRELSET